MNTKEHKPVFFENLDAIRAIAFLLVFVWHIFGYIHHSGFSFIETKFITHVAMNGHMGVNLFFVLSGFLITYLLLTEKESTGKINIGFFYIRRVLRIWPLYLAVILISFFIYPLVSGSFDANAIKEHLPFYLLFINNFDRIYSGFVGLGNDNPGVLWSIAVEEQFYLFWPLIILLFNKKILPYILYAIIIASLLFRALNVKNESIIYLHTFSVMSDLAVGSLLAYHTLYQTSIYVLLQNSKNYFIGFIYLIFLIVFLFYAKWSQFNDFTKIIERLLLSLFFAFAIGEQCFSKNSILKLGTMKMLSKVGLISYGLYCLHLYSIVVVQKINSVLKLEPLTTAYFYAEFILCLALSIALAYFSYTFFESKILKLRTRFTIVKTR